MLRSLNSGVSGLRAFQTKLDVIGNNIANVNTTGFKKGRVVFDDIFSQTIKGATAPSANSGGINPTQVGLGVKVATVENLFTTGSPAITNNLNDLYIDGDGFFVVGKGNDSFLTRAGNFTLDRSNQLVNPNGMVLQDTTGAPIVLPPESVSYSIDANGVITGVNKDGERLVGIFNNGVDANGEPVIASVTEAQLEAATEANTVAIQFPGFRQIKIGIANVANPSGLSKVGGSLYTETNSSGGAAVINANNISTAQIITGQLEMSNVDLSEEMTEMIIAQRAFQANTKIITTSDSILEELVNLKR